MGVARLGPVDHRLRAARCKPDAIRRARRRQNRTMIDLICSTPTAPPAAGWCGDDPLYRAYHDNEWGREKRGDDALFELLSLEGFQAGLSWLTILRKREGFRRAFAGFSIERVAGFDERDVERLLGRRGDRPPPRQDRGDDRQRRRGTRAARAGCRVRLGLRPAAPAGAADRDGRAAGDDARVDRSLEGAEAARLPASSARRPCTRSCSRRGSWTTTSTAASSWRSGRGDRRPAGRQGLVP